jgi:23S rRNA pseudouridine1911/1915/1917 synthase
MQGPGIKLSESLQEAIRNFNRQALHAARLGLLHPETNQPMSWQAELPEDMKTLLAALREDARKALETREESSDDIWWDPNQAYEIGEFGDDEDDWDEE